VLRRAGEGLDFFFGQNFPLLRALAFERLGSLREPLGGAEKQIAAKEAELHSPIVAPDPIWFVDGSRWQKPLAQIAVDLTFVQKWLAQVRERKIRLEELL